MPADQPIMHDPARTGLEGAVVLVIGASGGIGRTLSIAFVKQGAELYMHGRSPERLTLPPGAGGMGPAPSYIFADFNDDLATEEIALPIERRGRLDVLVLSSGAYARSLDKADFAKLLGANVIGPYALVRRLLPMLVEAKGQIVFINSTQALTATAGLGEYAASKHAWKALAESLRDEINSDGVRVVSVYLGRTATPMQQQVFDWDGQPYTPERLIQPDDVAYMVLAGLKVPRTTEVTDIIMRPMQKPQCRDLVRGGSTTLAGSGGAP